MRSVFSGFFMKTSISNSLRPLTEVLRLSSRKFRLLEFINCGRRGEQKDEQFWRTWGSTGHTNVRMLQTMVSGNSLVLRLSRRM